jgi:ATP-dependent DNA helicase RecG
LIGPAEGLRKVLALERQRKFANTAVIGGLDVYLLHFVQEQQLPSTHRLSRILQSLPSGGYRALHPVQRARVVEAVLTAVDNGLPSGLTSGPSAAILATPTIKPVLAATPRRAPPPARTVASTLESPVSVLTGRKKSLEGRLARLDVRTVGDLLCLFPKRYDDYSAIRPIAELIYGEHQTIIATVRSARVRTMGGRREVSEATVGDQTGSIKAIWWSGRWIAGRLKPGMRLALSGKIDAFGDRLQMSNPEWELLGAEAVNTRRIVPVYPLTDGLAQRDIRPLVLQAVDAFADKVEETLPDELRRERGLPPVVQALKEVHCPSSLAGAEAATRRFAFEELLNIELGVVRRRREWRAVGGAPQLRMSHDARNGFAQSLPFALTADQLKAIDDLLADISHDVPMTRLLEGDVGSGKTVVAAAALLAAVAGGYQGAIMAPTEILAEQHFRTLCRLLSPESAGAVVDGVWFQETAPGYVALRPPYMQQPVRIALLRGGLKAAEKMSVQEAIAKGEVDIAVGTHALVQQDVQFQRLGLAVVDEQHRFGVAQRAALREKGQSPHVLVMTATPIPRTLALTVYGDLDITVLREMPPGRPEVKTHRVAQRRRQEAYDFVRQKVGEGRQAYVICPLVEESEAIEAKAAVQEHQRLAQEVFPELRLGLLHGRMTPGEKDATMRAFSNGEMDVLVSTAVVEVGIDVPNATVMLIEAADRFGLTQLHQFRGRVRRSTEQSYCLLLSESASPEAEERLQIMVDVSDGFKLAEEDLRLRGAGDYFGTRQSGMPNLRIAKLTDVDLIEQARADATRLLDGDPELLRPEHAALRAQVEKLWDRVTAEAS